ncbi:hypothetical protein [Nostoc edaphicum]|nr:hypothetical protein [Nostoc edaphicum]
MAKVDTNEQCCALISFISFLYVAIAYGTLRDRTHCCIIIYDIR